MCIVDEMEVGRRRGMMMGFAPFPASSSSHQRSLFHRALLKGDSGLLIISAHPFQYYKLSKTTAVNVGIKVRMDMNAWLHLHVISIDAVMPIYPHESVYTL